MMNVKSIQEKQSKAGWGCGGTGAGRGCDADSIGIGPVRAVGRFGTLLGVGAPEGGIVEGRRDDPWQFKNFRVS